MKRTTLNNLKIGKYGKIFSIDSNNNDYLRLLEIGFTPNTVITPLRKSPSGDPTAYLVKNSVIALRKHDAEKITISFL